MIPIYLLYVLHIFHVLQSLTALFHNLWIPAPYCSNTEKDLSPIYFYLFNGRVLVYQLFQQVSNLQTDIKFGNAYFLAYWARQMNVQIIFGDIRWMGQQDQLCRSAISHCEEKAFAMPISYRRKVRH